MVKVARHASYNPAAVLSSCGTKDEYDYLFQTKVLSDDSSVVGGLLSSVTSIGHALVEIFTGNPDADQIKLGERQRVSTQYAAGFQCSLGLAKVLTGDVYSGLYNSLLGLLGMSCSREGKNKEMLKTYVVITFINGMVQAMEVFQVSLTGISFFTHGVPLAMKAGHVIAIMNPCASFLGAYIGWQYIKAAKHQYLTALAHYQLQMLMMHQQQQMMQAMSTQQQQLNRKQSMGRLPAIEETFEEEFVSEATGGSEGKFVDVACVNAGGVMIRE